MSANSTTPAVPIPPWETRTGSHPGVQTTMSDYITEHDEDAEDDKLVQLKRSQIRALEKKARRADEAEQKALELERKIAIRDAGIPNTPMGRYFADTYNGELTAEAIAAKAAEIGLVQQETAPVVPAEELEAHRRIEAAFSGANEATGPDFGAALQNARSKEEALALINKAGLLRGPR